MLASQMPPNNTPFTAKLAVNFQYVEPRWTVNHIEVIQSSSAHQIMIATVTYPIKDALPGSNIPVTLEYGQRNYDLQTYYGYVNHIQHLSNNQAEIWTIGASSPMRSGALKVWNNVSPSYIARTLAVKYKLRLVTDVITERVTLIQTGQSDFEFLTELADRIGFKFYVLGTTLYFINPLLPLRSSPNSIQWFFVTPSVFQPRIGEVVPGGSNITDKTSFALDAETGQIIGAKNQYSQFLAFGESQTFNPMFKEYTTSNTSSSVKELTSKLNAEVSSSINWVTAAASLYQGSATVHPGSVIGVQGTVADKFQGLWLVDSIKQTLSPGYNGWNYSSNVALMRDQVYGASIRPSVTWSQSSGTISTKWLNGVWISEQVGG